MFVTVERPIEKNFSMSFLKISFFRFSYRYRMIHPFISGISSIPSALPTLQSSLKSYDPAAGSQIQPYRTPLPYSTSIRECMFRSIMNCSHVDCSCMDCSCLNFFYIPILRLKIFIVKNFSDTISYVLCSKNLFLHTKYRALVHKRG